MLLACNEFSFWERSADYCIVLDQLADLLMNGKDVAISLISIDFRVGSFIRGLIVYYVPTCIVYNYLRAFRITSHISQYAVDFIPAIGVKL